MSDRATQALRSVRSAAVAATPVERARLVLDLLEEVHSSVGDLPSGAGEDHGPYREKRALEAVIAAARTYAADVARYRPAAPEQRTTGSDATIDTASVASRPGGVTDSGNVNLEMQYRTPSPADGEPVTITQVQLLRLLQTISQACEYDTPNRPQLGAAWAFLTAVHTRDLRDSSQLEDAEWERLNAMPITPPSVP